MRYDHFMKLGWKVLIPVSLAWLVAVTLIQGVTTFAELSRQQLFIGIGVAFLVAMVVVLLIGDRTPPEGEEPRDGEFIRPDEEFDAFAGGFPVPPLPGQSLPPSPRAKRVTAKEADRD